MMLESKRVPRVIVQLRTGTSRLRISRVIPNRLSPANPVEPALYPLYISRRFLHGTSSSVSRSARRRPNVESPSPSHDGQRGCEREDRKTFVWLGPVTSTSGINASSAEVDAKARGGGTKASCLDDMMKALRTTKSPVAESKSRQLYLSRTRS